MSGAPVPSRPNALAALALVAAACACAAPPPWWSEVGDDPLLARASPLAGVDFVGSEACAPCHPAEAEQWRASPHATTIRDAELADEDALNDIIQCSGMGFTHVLGDRHHVRWLRERDDVSWGEGRWLALPCGWDVHDKEVTFHHRATWRELPFETGCAACHATGWRAEDHGFLEVGVGCEECHGPGGRHVTSAAKDDILRLGGSPAPVEVTVCASCHLQGGRSLETGLKFGPRYVAGGSLFDDYRFDWSQLEPSATAAGEAMGAAAGSPIDVHQKLLVRRVVFDGDRSLACTSCHSLHRLTHEKHAELPPEPYCLTCHHEDMTLKEYSQSCNVCEF